MSSSLAPGFMVIHGNRLEDLRDVMLSWQQQHPLPPLSPEVVLVQSNGMNQWLIQSMAQVTGVAAGLDISLPNAFLWRAYREVLGDDAVPKHMLFDKDFLRWRLMRLLPQLCEQHTNTYAALLDYLQSDADGRRLYQLASSIADVFDQYQSYRADWLRDWSNGVHRLQDVHGQGIPLPEDQLWQSHLWHAIHADVVQHDELEVSRSAIHARFIDTISRLTDRPEQLPQRICVFGVSSLPMQSVEALAALGKLCQVMLFVQNPCQYYWGDILEERTLLRHQLTKKHRQGYKADWSASMTDAARYAQANPLLAAWGKQGRDYIALLSQVDQPENYQHRFQQVDVFVPVAGDHLLAQVHNAILTLDSPPSSPRVLADNDHSIVYRSAYSSQREVEMLHDHLLDLFEANRALTPRDVMVMVPDMMQFAPHIQAVFGRFDVQDARYIPFALADVSSVTEPMVQVFTWLLTLPEKSITVSDWQALFAIDAVRRRFDLTEDEVDRLYQWIVDAGVRWGLNGQHRTSFGMPETILQNTWLFGLQRMLLGYAVGHAGPWQGIEPLSDVAGLAANHVGVLAQWVALLTRLLPVLQQPHSPNDWQLILMDALDALVCVEHDVHDASYFERIQASLLTWVETCQMTGFTQPIFLSVVREHLLSQLTAPSIRHPFLNAGVQFATLMPMRTIPFKIVCMLGMNDGAYPRQHTAVDFDLMAITHLRRPGDRSRREDDRYLFLEALLSARDQLYISWTGRDVRDDSHRPPSVLVTQLMDYIAQGWTPAPTCMQYPLQAFSKRYTQAESAFSTYVSEWLVDTSSAHQEQPPVVWPPAERPNCLSIDELVTLLKAPVSVFYQHRLGVRLSALKEENYDDEAFSLTALDRFKLLNRFIVSADVQDKLSMSDRVPLAGFGTLTQQALVDQYEVISEQVCAQINAFPQRLNALPVTFSVQATQLEGVLDSLYSDAQSEPTYLNLHVRPGNVFAKKGAVSGHVLPQLWISHLFACASGRHTKSILVGLDGHVVYNALSIEEAFTILTTLIDCYHTALNQPLALGCKTACQYLAAYQDHGQKDPHLAAQEVFEGSRYAMGEYHGSLYLPLVCDTYNDIRTQVETHAHRLYAEMLARVVS